MDDRHFLFFFLLKREIAIRNNVIVIAVRSNAYIVTFFVLVGRCSFAHRFLVLQQVVVGWLQGKLQLH